MPTDLDPKFLEAAYRRALQVLHRDGLLDLNSQHNGPTISWLAQLARAAAIYLSVIGTMVLGGTDPENVNSEDVLARASEIWEREGLCVKPGGLETETIVALAEETACRAAASAASRAN